MTNHAINQSNNMAEPLLSVRDLAVNYGPVKAVKGISFDLMPGQITTLVGANGAGKSTTLLALSGLVKKLAGRVMFGGKDVTFTLAGSGHIAGVINAPAAKKYQHWTNPALPATLAEWQADAVEHPGSW